MRGLNHPGIVRLLGFQESREHYYLTLEYVSRKCPDSKYDEADTARCPG